MEFSPLLLETIMFTHPKNKIECIKEHPEIEKCYEMFAKEGFGMFWVRNKS